MGYPISKLIKIFLRIVFGIIILFLLFYCVLWIWSNNFVPKELKIMYTQNIESYLNDEQYNIILFSKNGNKNHRFKWYPFMFDFIFSSISLKNHNYIASMTASTIAGEYFSNNIRKFSNGKWHVMNYGLMRYIVFKNDYRKCIDIIYKNNYMGENIFGIKSASEYFFEKNIKDISNEELISLIVLSCNPETYKVNNEENKSRTLKIINEYGL